LARIAVIGMGAIGTAVAGALESVGRHDLLLCARRELEGPICVEPHGLPRIDVTAPRTSDPLAGQKPVDWILLAVKAHQTASAAPWLEQLRGPSSVVVPLQNGVEQVATIGSVAPGALVLPAVVWIGSTLSAPHCATVVGGAALAVPDDDHGTAFASLLDGSFVGVRVVDDLRTEAWRKLCLNVVASLEALTGRPAVSFRNPELQEVGRTLARECVAVARAEGANLTDAHADEAVALLAGMRPEAQASILSDRLEGRPLEWDALVGVVRRLGARHSIATPVADVVVPLLAATED
jgi:2-dehydropantoate 2-reductase